MNKTVIVVMSVFAGAVLLLFIVVPVLVIRLMPRDIPPFDDARLRPETFQIAPESNAYTYFLQATNFLVWSTNTAEVDAVLNGTAADLSFAVQLVASNHAALALVRQGLTCDRCVAPEVTDLLAPTPNLTPWLYLGRVLAMKAKIEIKEGDAGGAKSSSLELVRFGWMIQDCPSSLIHYSVGKALSKMGDDACQNLVLSGHLDEKQLVDLSNRLASYAPSQKGFVRAIQLEYQMTSKTIDDLCAGRFITNRVNQAVRRFAFPLVFQPNRAKQEGYKAYLSIIDSSSNSFKVITSMKSEAKSEQASFPPEAFRIQRHLASTIAGLFSLSPVDTLGRECRSRCSFDATRVIIALHRYRIRYSEFPETLDDLVHEFLPAAPTDAFAGESLRYSPKRGIVYSVGKNCVDDGGSEESLDPPEPAAKSKKGGRTKDLVFRIE
ncbi:MAG: hypothetical protein HY343_13080 [Lentisphaerae bacterium]|nr:hypothetical protein [Lentisphaerota bacterium]